MQTGRRNNFPIAKLIINFMIFYAINYLTENTLPYILNMLLINLFGTKNIIESHSFVNENYRFCVGKRSRETDDTLMSK